MPALPVPSSSLAEAGTEQGAVGSGAAVHTDSEDVARRLLAGGLAGCFAKTATAPLDRVKILFQGRNTTFTDTARLRGGWWLAMKRIVERQGLVGLWKGHSAMLARIFPYSAINFAVFDYMKRVLVPEGQPLFPLARLVCGSIAGTASVLVTYPLDLTRARLAYQMKHIRYRGIFHTMLSMAREDGWLSVYRGFVPTLLGILPYAGISFYTNDTLKVLLRRYMPQLSLNPQGEIHVRYQLLCGAIAGVCAQTAAYPLDVVRRRMQLAGMATNVPVYSGTFQALQAIWRTESVNGLFLGLSINYVKVAPAMAISFVSYEQLKKYLGVSGPPAISVG